MRAPRGLRQAGLVAVALTGALALTACGDDGGGGEASGSDVYSANCARCHGPEGQGGVGPKLGDGQVAERYEDIEDQIAVITNGRGGMPAFDGQLSAGEIRAVAEYERTEL